MIYRSTEIDSTIDNRNLNWRRRAIQRFSKCGPHNRVTGKDKTEAYASDQDKCRLLEQLVQVITRRLIWIVYFFRYQLICRHDISIKNSGTFIRKKFGKYRWKCCKSPWNDCKRYIRCGWLSHTTKWRKKEN